MTIRLALAAALVLLPGLSACGPNDDANAGSAPATARPTGPAVPASGQCFAREIPEGNTDVAPDLSSRVPCTEPHVYEITGVVDIPKKFLDTSTPAAARKRRAAIVRPGGPDSLYMQVGKAVNCAEKSAQLSGVRSMAFKKKYSAGMLKPAISHSGGWSNIAPPKLWNAGHYVVICSWRFGDDKPKAVRSTVNGKTLIEQSFLPTFPDNLRDCLDIDAVPVACSKPHQLERAFQLNVSEMVGADVTTLSERDRFEKQIGACGAVLLLAGGDTDSVDHPLAVGRNDGAVDCYFQFKKPHTAFQIFG